MHSIKNKFLRLIKGYISEKNYKALKHQDSSPLAYAIDALGSNPDSNDIKHSYRVALNCFNLAKGAGLILRESDYLILLYSSLLHDISKSNENDIKKDIKNILKKKNPLFLDSKCDHGIRSAHYIEERNKDKLTFFGLKKKKITQMYRMIAFHSSAIFHSPYQRGNLYRDDVLLCLLFWVSDVSDGICKRVASAATARRKSKSAKVRAREQIYKTTFCKEQIRWFVEEINSDVKQAAKLANKELSKHKLLLQAFRLPSQIIIGKRSEGINESANLILNEDLGRCNLLFDLKDRKTPLQISKDNLFEAYESIVEAFQNINVNGQPLYRNYFGPLLIEIKDTINNHDDNIIVRNNQNLKIADIKDYTKSWLDTCSNAECNFYFGYTHGQRLNEYVYAKDPVDLDNKEFHKWRGKRKQIESILDILKNEKKDARRAYAVIAHPVIDDSNKNDFFYTNNVVQPALLAIHFRIEMNKKLSAFAFLRSQEMSTFFLVNYFELKELIEDIASKLSLIPGRIVMITSLAYFDMDTTLLDKPTICKIYKNSPSTIRGIAQGIDNRNNKDKFIEMLKELQNRTHIKTEYEWIKYFIENLPKEDMNKPLRQAMCNLKKVLIELSKQQYSVIPKKLIKEKEQAVKGVINIF